MNKEMKALYDNDTWDIIDLPSDRKAIGNDIIVIGSDIHEIEKFKEFLKKYRLDLLSEFGLLTCKPSVIPLEHNLSISNEPTDTDLLIDNITEYQKLIGKLIYLTHTKPDIAYSVHYLVIATKKISYADQTSDVLTKGLDKTQHDKLILKMECLMFSRLELRGDLSLSLVSFLKDEDSSWTVFVKMGKCFGS
ncbi:ribonuclease H-like domain-containing protein [Tanacetum coccineum]